MFAVLDGITGELDADIRALEEEAIDTMTQYGLELVELTDDEVDVWINELVGSYEVTLGLVFDEEFYQELQGLLDEYRSRL
jgi:hypothetical protein